MHYKSWTLLECISLWQIKGQMFIKYSIEFKLLLKIDTLVRKTAK